MSSPPPRGYCLLIGLSEVDATADFYRRVMGGFDGRRGCEGARRDVEMMRSLTHYLGYEPVVLEPLINERATRARVLGILEEIGKPEFGIQGQDILFIYLSCHGRLVAGGGGPGAAATLLGGGQLSVTGPDAGLNVTAFLLHDRPIFNYEIWTPLLQFSGRPHPASQPRVFSMVDACHAGLGTALEGFAAFQEDASRAFSSRNSLPAASTRFPALLQLVQRMSSLRLVHFGAARDELTAAGGPLGSLYTRRFRQYFLNGGQGESYAKFHDQLSSLLPAKHEPVWEVLGGHGQGFAAYEFFKSNAVLDI